MDRQSEIELTVNGERVKKRIDVRLNLVDFLRDELELTGSHIGCEHGVCGACTVRVDGEIIRGCLMLAVQADGTQVETIEGASDNGSLAQLQDAFLRHNALQCGFCTPGMLLTAQELIAKGEPVSREQVRDYLSGNYCRCTGYQSIVEAVVEVANKTTKGKAK